MYTAHTQAQYIHNTGATCTVRLNGHNTQLHIGITQYIHTGTIAYTQVQHTQALCMLSIRTSTINNICLTKVPHAQACHVGPHNMHLNIGIVHIADRTHAKAQHGYTVHTQLTDPYTIHSCALAQYINSCNTHLHLCTHAHYTDSQQANT